MPIGFLWDFEGIPEVEVCLLRDLQGPPQGLSRNLSDSLEIVAFGDSGTLTALHVACDTLNVHIIEQLN